MTRPQKSSVKRKVTAVIMLASVTVLLLTVTAFMIYDLVTARRAMEQNLGTQARMIAENSTAAVAFKNENDAMNVLASLRAEPHIVAAAIYDAQGKLFVKYPAQIPDAELPAKPQNQGYQFGQAHLDLYQPVIQSEKRLGTLYLQSDLTALSQRLQLYGMISLLIILGSLLVAFWLSNLLQRSISNPIIALAETTRKISGQRDYSLRARKLTDDEMGSLTDSFNDMLELIQASDFGLRESEARFRHMANSAPVLIWMSGTDKLCNYFNKRWLEFTGRTLDQELGNGWAEGVHSDDLPRCLDIYNRSFDARQEFEMEYRLKRHDGEYRWISDHGVPRFVSADEFIGYIGSCADITERKQAEIALQQAKDKLAESNEWLEKRVRERTVDLIQANTALETEIVARKQAEMVHAQLAAIVESSSDAILSETPAGIITSWNKGAEKMFGYTAEEIVGRSVSILIPVDRSDELGPKLESVQREETVEPFETVRVRKDGHAVHVSLTLSPIKDEAGHITGVSAIMQDISERKRLEAEILQVSEREQRRIAEDLHDGVGQQLGGISCLSDVLKKNLAEQASPETEAAAKISKLLNDAMAQIRSLARGLHPVTPEANGLMSALEGLAARVSDLFKASCHFECPEQVLVEDNAMATHIYRIAQEAVTNALKHGKAQQIKIELFSTTERIILAVSDDGVGFKRSESHSKGLGLRIMNHRAGMIGGNFVVQKKNGGGTVAACTVQINNGQAPKN